MAAASSGVGWKATSGQNLRRVVFEEVVALSPEQADAALKELMHRIKHADPNPLLVHGISPHAPYSVSSELYKLAAEQARDSGMPLATHVAETKAELEFIRKNLSSGNYWTKSLKAQENVSPQPFMDSFRGRKGARG